MICIARFSEAQWRMSGTTRKIFAAISLAGLLIGGGLVVAALPGAAPEAEAAAARQAQADWSAQRTHDIINRKPWNGVRRPADAPGAPLDGVMLLIGIAVLFGAAGMGIGAVRAHRC